MPGVALIRANDKEDIVKFPEFIVKVQERGGFADREQAERATKATLQTLGERLAGGEPTDLAAQLPEEVARYLAADGPGQSFDLNEFYERVAEREQTGLSPAQAREHAMAVMSTVVDAVTPGQVNHLAAQLPDEYQELLR
jgi:uncharacterized protein (DUF2267 family)